MQVARGLDGEGSCDHIPEGVGRDTEGQRWWGRAGERPWDGGVLNSHTHLRRPPS